MTNYSWTQHPEAEALVNELVSVAVIQSPALAALDGRLRSETSTALINWLDHISGPISEERLREAGFVDGFRTTEGLWRHPGAQLPAIIPSKTYGVGLRVDDVVAFAHAMESASEIEGSPRSGLRRVEVHYTPKVVIAAVERRSWAQGTTPQIFDEVQTLNAVKAWQLWDERPRANVAGVEGAVAIADLTKRAQQMVKLTNSDLAASYALELERQHWQRRNTAAVIQHARQDRLGLGWGNNDHHTFRSSRVAFQNLILLFNELGFESRERFYAGEQAGWGAQVLEHPGCGGVLFCDVDLGSAEVGMDFSSSPLPEAEKLGTIGMWCALHGESILSAGMHHLEGQFEFDALRDDLNALGIVHMKPFSDFPHLRQAFTQAEKWPVSESRLQSLVAAGHIDQEKAKQFQEAGAAGSHLENLQRREGFKGFNQNSVSDTMRVTDPRTL